MSIPTSDSALLAWSLNFLTVAEPTPEDFGMTKAQIGDYATTQSRYALALAKAQAPETRTRVSVNLKNQAKTSLVSSSRTLSSVCESWPQMTNDKRLQLGITVRKARASRVPVPSAVPMTEIDSVKANIVTVIVRNPLTGKRDKPKGVHGISIYSYVGDLAPIDPGVMKFEGSTTDTKGTVTFATALEPFTKIWLSSCYTNPRGQAGPGSVPIATNLGTWSVRAVPATGGMKIAA